MTNPQTEARALPELPDDDSDFTPDLARKIIEIYQTALAAKDVELVKANMLACANAQDAADESERAERQWAGWVKEEALRKAAEAQLAEANKALEEIGNGCDGRADRESLPCRIARRAIASGGKQ